MTHVLVLGKMHPQGIDLLRARPQLKITMIEDEFAEDFAAAVADSDAIAVRTGTLTAELLDCAQRLKIVSRHGVGYDNIDVVALTRRRIPVAIAADANAVSVAEHMLYLMLALAKQGAAYDQATRSGDFAFRNSLQAIDLWQKTLLILGMGRIGRQVARRCQALDMRLLAYDPYIDQTIIRAHGCEPVSDLSAALASADVVTLHFPGGGANVKFIDHAKLQQLKSSAFLINTARGDVVDEAALYECLHSGRLRGAGLDVFAEEPTPADHPLLQLDNVIVSPHSAATTQEGAVRMSVRTIRNLLDALDGKLDPEMVVNKDVLNTN